MATPIPQNQARFTVDEVLAAIDGRLVGRPATAAAAVKPAQAVSVTSDSRAVTEGSLFVALRGAAHDGHAFIPAAVRAGASLVVVERGAAPDIENGRVVAIEVRDTLVAWGALAAAHLERWRTGHADRRVVAITGSAGKTTTKELTAALLAEVAPTHFSAGNLNNRVGVPAVVFALASERYCVLEMGMSLPGEIAAITGFAPPDVSVVVNVGVAHAEGVGGLEGVMHEKGAVYRALGPSGIAIVNADDRYVVRAAAEARPSHVVTFGRAEHAGYRLVSRTPTRAGSRIVVAARSRELTLELPLFGEAAAVDFAAALATQEAASGVVLGEDAIARALGRVRLEGRGAALRFGDVLVIDDTYNANPASVRAGLDTLAELAGTGHRRVAVLGEMKELGALAEEEHRALGDAVVRAKVALLIGCGGLITLALERARSHGVEVVDASDAAVAAEEAAERVRAGDVVLVKASRSVRAERVVAALAARGQSAEHGPRRA